MNGFGSYLWLEVRRTLRNGRYVVFTLGFPAGFYLLFTMLYGQQAASGGYDFNTLYMVAMAAYGAMGAALNSNSVALAGERAGGWTRQLRVTPLAPLAYVLAKAAMAVCVALPALALVSLLGVLVHHVHLSGQAWAAYLIATWLGTLPFAALGVLMGYAFDPQSAQGGMMIVYFGLSILGGMWFPYQIMPHAMQVLARALPSYHFASLGWNAVAGRWVGWGNLGVLAAYTAAFAGAALRRYQRDEAREYA
jgi:ABC-2 type transport system permease protein